MILSVKKKDKTQTKKFLCHSCSTF